MKKNKVSRIGGEKEVEEEEGVGERKREEE